MGSREKTAKAFVDTARFGYVLKYHHGFLMEDTENNPDLSRSAGVLLKAAEEITPTVKLYQRKLEDFNYEYFAVKC